MPNFLQQLHSLLSNPAISNVIAWVVPTEDEPDDQGAGLTGIGKIVVYNATALEEFVLGKYFGQSSYGHFQQELLAIGFRKSEHTYTVSTGLPQACSFVNEGLGPDRASLFQLGKSNNASMKQGKVQSTRGKKKRGAAVKTANDTVYAPRSKKSTEIKEHLIVGDEVYGCWLGDGNNDWFVGTIESSKVVGRTVYGEVRTYSVLFEDGDRDDALHEMFVWGKENYLLEMEINNKQRPLHGVQSRKDPRSKDEYAQARGWYVTELTDRKFATVREAMEAYDFAYVRNHGNTANPNKMNFPENWIFLPNAVPRKRVTNESLKRKSTAASASGSYLSKKSKSELLSQPNNIFQLAWTISQLETSTSRKVALGEVIEMSTGEVKEALIEMEGFHIQSAFQPAHFLTNGLIGLFEKYHTAIAKLFQMRSANGGLDELCNLPPEVHENYTTMNNQEVELAWLMEESKLVSNDTSCDWTYILENASPCLSSNIEITKRLSPKYFNDPAYYITDNNEEEFLSFCEEVAKALEKGFRRMKTMQKLPPLV